MINGRRARQFAIGTSLAVCAVVWMASYALAVEYTFRPISARWCQTGFNFGTVYFATQPWPTNIRHYGLLVYDARNRGVSLGGLGVYASLSGPTPGGHNNVAIVSLPLWLPIAIIASLAVLRWRSTRAAATLVSSPRCRACGYDLRASPIRCPECGATTHPGGAAVA